MKVHELKTHPQYYNAVVSGKKTFEIRENDRDYQVGDLLVLREWNPESEGYTGASELRFVSYVTTYGQPEGQVVLALQEVRRR